LREATAGVGVAIAGSKATIHDAKGSVPATAAIHPMIATTIGTKIPSFVKLLFLFAAFLPVVAIRQSPKNA
jgi:hypothetical protein